MSVIEILHMSVLLLPSFFRPRVETTRHTIPGAQSVPTTFPVGFTVSHHAKTWNTKIPARMRILDLGRLRKVDPRRSEQISECKYHEIPSAGRSRGSF